MASFLKIQRKSTVLHVTLDRPEAHNALNPELISGLTEIFKEIKKDKSIRAAVLRGEGPSFCAGGDLQWMRQSLKFTLKQNLKDTQKLSDMFESMFQCPVPVLGLVHGNVMGGGLGLTAICDIVAADFETKFCFSEVRLGLVPSIISPYVLRKMTESTARGLMLTAEIFNSSVAEKTGLVHFVGNQEQREIYLREKLDLIVKNGPEATRITKELIQKIKTSTWPKCREVTVKTIAQRRSSKEGQEGMNCFFEKRSPSWKSIDTSREDS